MVGIQFLIIENSNRITNKRVKTIENWLKSQLWIKIHSFYSWTESKCRLSFYIQ